MFHGLVIHVFIGLHLVVYSKTSGLGSRKLLELSCENEGPNCYAEQFEENIDGLTFTSYKCVCSSPSPDPDYSPEPTATPWVSPVPSNDDNQKEQNEYGPEDFPFPPLPSSNWSSRFDDSENDSMNDYQRNEEYLFTPAPPSSEDDTLQKKPSIGQWIGAIGGIGAVLLIAIVLTWLTMRSCTDYCSKKWGKLVPPSSTELSNENQFSPLETAVSFLESKKEILNTLQSQRSGCNSSRNSRDLIGAMYFPSESSTRMNNNPSWNSNPLATRRYV